MEARKRFMSLDPTKLPDPPMPSYTFSIYHRDVFEKSKFKDYDSLLENRLARCHARANYLASVLGSQTAQGGEMREPVPKSTDTQLIDGEHVASFLIGTQMTKNYLLIDTGSDLIWWQCGPCEANKCYVQTQPLYDSTTSDSFGKVDRNQDASRCKTGDPTYNCNLQSSECRYYMAYRDGSATRGFIADEVITFVLDQQLVSVTFGCSKYQVGLLMHESSGKVGLGRDVLGGYSLPSQFGVKIMSICQSSFDSGERSVLSFHTSKWPRAHSAKLLPNYVHPSVYFVNLYKVFINNKEVSVSPSWWNFKPDMSGGIMVDTGTTLTYFPHDFYIIFRDIFRSEVRNIPMVENPVFPFDTCYANPNDRMLFFPVVKLYFGRVNMRNKLALAQEQVIVKIQDLYCLAFIGWKQDFSILGVHQLQGVGLTFDTSANTLSFDLDECD